MPTLAMYLLRAQHHGSVGSRNPFTRFQQAFERGFARLRLEGADLDGNRQVANQPLTDLRQVPGLTDLRIQQPLDSPNFEVAVDRTKAAQGGFTVRDVASSVPVSLSGSFQTTPIFFPDWQNGVNYNPVHFCKACRNTEMVI